MSHEETIDTAQRVAKARRQGDEHLAMFLTRAWQKAMPPYGTDECRQLQAAFDEAYRNANKGVTR